MRLGAWLVGALAVLATLLTTDVLAAQDQDSFQKLAQRSPDGVLKLTPSLFKDLMSSKRDYDVFILYTALGARFRCVACQMVDQPFSDVARGIKSGKHRNKLLMAKADAEDNVEIFRAVCAPSPNRPAEFEPCACFALLQAVEWCHGSLV